MPKSDLRKPLPIKRGSFYYPEPDDPHIAVTTVLNMVAKPALQRWAAGLAAEAALADPSLSLKDATDAPWKYMDKAADKGKLIHSWAEAINNGKRPEDTKLPEDAAGWGKAFIKFQRQVHIIPLFNEVTVVNSDYGYAGTIDHVGEFHDSSIAIIDYKTGKGVYEWEHSLQLSAYLHGKKLLNPATREVYDFDMSLVKQAFVVHLKGDGNYEMYEMPDRFTEFLGYLHLFFAEKGKPCRPACWHNQLENEITFGMDPDEYRERYEMFWGQFKGD